LSDARTLGDDGSVSARTLGGVGVAGATNDTRPPRPLADRLTGRTLGGRYDVLELLGAGGMGAVYRALDRELDEIVALKVIRGEVARERGAVEQFRQEVKLARRVTHVNIARTFELGVEDDLMFCTMELVEGESLRDRLTREGALPLAQAVAIASALCEGLVVAHAAGVIHRDIKPENVLVTASGRVVLADFGVAAFSAADSDGRLVGTLEYMAPEQARGEQATPATDIYAIGVVLFEMLCGLRAFSGTMSELIVDKQDREMLSLDFADAVAREPIPRALAELVEQATARDPARRIASAAELAQRLAGWLRLEGAVTSPGVTLAPETEAINLAVIVVLAPRVLGEGVPLHLAEGIHQELLRRLASRRLRVWARVDAFDMPGATFVELVAGARLHVTLRRDELASTLELPLDLDSIALAADAIAVAAEELARRALDSDERERLDLLLRTRAYAHSGFGGIRPAIELLEQGRARWPDDPQIACQLADLMLRFVFVGQRGSFYDARPLVEAALAGAPHLAEAHVAAGQLALHTGDPVHAAREFRIAVACSPYLAEPHEGLGRMLLEAGYLDDAMARLDSALAIAPKLSSVRWEIARAHALEQNWVEHDRLLAELLGDGDRPIARLRFALWRGELARVPEIHQAWKTWGAPFEPELFDRVFAIILEGSWPRDREVLIRQCLEARSPSKRRLAFLTQIAAELAGFAGEPDTCLALLARTVELDLYDRHWFERCPTIADARATPEGQRLVHQVKTRAEAILDAFYGERSDRASVAETVIIP